MNTVDTNISFSRQKLKEFCLRNHITRFSFFGSVLRDDFDSETSDIDILVEFETGHVPGFFSLFDLEEELSVMFGGVPVDLRTKEDLSHFFRNEVLNNLQVHYEA